MWVTTSRFAARNTLNPSTISKASSRFMPPATTISMPSTCILLIMHNITLRGVASYWQTGLSAVRTGADYGRSALINIKNNPLKTVVMALAGLCGTKLYAGQRALQQQINWLNGPILRELPREAQCAELLGNDVGQRGELKPMAIAIHQRRYVFADAESICGTRCQIISKPGR